VDGAPESTFDGLGGPLYKSANSLLIGEAYMKFAIFSLVALMMSGIAMASVDASTPESDASSSSANIQSGNWNAGGNLSFTQDYQGGLNETSYSASVNSEYFLINRLALGMVVGFEAREERKTSANLGPSATFFFWNEGKIASFVGGAFQVGLTEGSWRSIAQANLGLEYFLVPTVALGPSVYINHYNGKFNSAQRLGVSLNLGVYL
jgi:hypothetical protein